MELNEASRQVLSTLKRSVDSGGPTDRESLETAGQRYESYKEDWSGAFRALLEAGLICVDRDYRLSRRGMAIAKQCALERPDVWWYWYRDFHAIAPQSRVHAEFCEKVYGQDLCQHGMADMHELALLLETLKFDAGQHVLELGCGSGAIACHIRQQTGARLTGIDYSAIAIEAANQRRNDDDGLHFLVNDMNALELGERRFDSAISVDTLYFADDITATLARVMSSLKPRATLGLFFTQWIDDGQDIARLQPEQTDLARAFETLELKYEWWNLTDSTRAHLRLHLDTLAAMRDEFISAQHEFLYEFRLQDMQWMSAYLERDRISRHLYRAQMR